MHEKYIVHDINAIDTNVKTIKCSNFYKKWFIILVIMLNFYYQLKFQNIFGKTWIDTNSRNWCDIMIETATIYPIICDFLRLKYLNEEIKSKY